VSAGRGRREPTKPSTRGFSSAQRRSPLPLSVLYSPADTAHIEEVNERLMIDKRSLGAGGPQVGALGYGAMVLEGYYGASDDAEAVDTSTAHSTQA